MFKCKHCKVTSLPRVKPVMFVYATRTRVYDYLDIEGNPVQSQGTEIVEEGRICSACAGVEVKPEPKGAHPLGSSGLLAESLQNPLAPPMRMSMAAVVAFNALKRAEHNTKRAMWDLAAAARLSRDYKG